MDIHSYHRYVQVPADSAVEAVRRAGLPISRERGIKQMDAWDTELKDLERYVEGEAAKRGITLKYSVAHSCEEKPLLDLLYSPRGLGLEVMKTTEETKRPSTDSEALLEYAAIGSNHNKMNGKPFEDNPLVYAILKIKSISKARATHLGGLLKWQRADGCCHPKFRRNLMNTTRLSAEDPPVQQLPEKADPEIAKLVKNCIIPRDTPWLGNPDDWDPRKHGWIGKVDVKGAEALVRSGCIARCSTSSPYLRAGRDIHSKTASILYLVPEGTYGKGTVQREVVGKQSYFLLIFGGSWHGLQRTMWQKARMHLSDADAQTLHTNFFNGYPDLKARYEVDTQLYFKRGYIEDLYGGRWWLPAPPNCYYENGDVKIPTGLTKSERSSVWRKIEHDRHVYANKPTQCTQGSTTLFWIALCYHGEYVVLQVPPCWQDRGVPFPEAKDWQLNEGGGPGGKPLRAWINNTVHDSGWLDGAPGTLEAAAKVAIRRANGIPADFLSSADMPWQVEMEVGPDLGHLRPYNKVAQQFGLECIPS